jgi:bacillithiol system protein YtxJ
MNWTELEEYCQINNALQASKPFVVFKHSTRCSISSMVKSRFERNYDLDDVQAFHLDLIQFRSISNQLATDFNVVHQSPQLMLIKDGECKYHASHNAIDLSDLKVNI